MRHPRILNRAAQADESQGFEEGAAAIGLISKSATRAGARAPQGVKPVLDIAIDVHKLDRRIARAKVLSPAAEHGIHVRDHAAEILVAPGAGVGPEVGREAVRHLERSGVDYDGVFAVTDSTAVGVLAGLAEAGRRVPQDVQVVGFDNQDLAEFTVPGLTSVDPGRDAVAHHAARLLQRRIDGATPEPEHVVVPVRLVERGTTRAS